MFGGFGVCYAVVLAFLLRDLPRAAVGGRIAYRITRSAEPAFVHRGPWCASGSFLMLVAVFSAFSFVNWVVLTWLPTYLREFYELSQGPRRVGRVAAEPGGGVFVGILIGGFWADRWSRRNIRSRMLVPLVGSLPGRVRASSTRSPRTFCRPRCWVWPYMASVRASPTPTGMPILCQIADPRSRATGYGVMNLCSCPGGWRGGLGVSGAL